MTKFIKDHKKEIFIALGGIALAGIGGVIGFKIGRYYLSGDCRLRNYLASITKYKLELQDHDTDCLLSDMGEFGEKLIETYDSVGDTEIKDKVIKEVVLFMD